MKKRNIPVILLLPLLSLSCSLSHKMERSISKVGLSQAGKRPAPDTTCYSVPEKITWKDSSGVEHIVTMAERDSVTGEEMTVLQLDEVTIVARNRNIPERAGKVNLDFVVTVPGRLIDDKWQVQLTPVAYKRGRRIELERIFLSGADFVKRQKKGYAQYQAFINSIIPDSAYLKEMFDMKGYRRAMAELEEEFYQAWKHDYIAREEWIDWTERWNRRYQHFNAKMERNRMAIAGHNTILSVLPAYWLRRDLDTTLIPSRYRMFSEGTPLKVRRVTPEDSARIAERYFDYKRIAENERKRDAVSRKYEELVRFPYQAARLDTVIRNRNNTFSYYYRQEMDVTDNTKRIDLTVDGRILAVNGSSAKLPSSDTITYYISSMVQFLDYAPRYRKEKIYRKATANTTAYINYPAGRYLFDEEYGNNRSEIDKVLEAINKLTYTGELVMDSIDMTATASPEGSAAANRILSRQRAVALKEYLSGRTDDRTGIDTLIRPRWIGEDWQLLVRKVQQDTEMDDRSAVLDIMSSVKDPDAREAGIRKRFPDAYKHIRENYYPLARAVNFAFYLHRRDMIEEFKYTTVLDSAYMHGLDLMEDRQYKDALVILSDYNDYNTAICLMSLGYDARAAGILESLPESSNVCYLLSILYSRLKDDGKAVSSFMRSLELDGSKAYRGRLDPEINRLITTYNLNLSQYE